MRVAVICGGPSFEAEVSRVSARAVEQALREAGHSVALLELDERLPAGLLACAPEVVFPVVHGRQGEDGCLQGLLEVLRFPYVGSDVRASAIAADKAATKMFFASAGMDLAKDRVLSSDLPRTQWARVFEELRVELGQAFLVKPVHGGSTLGMSRIGGTSTPRDFEQALEQAFHHDDSVLVEEFIDGAELTCGVLDLLGDTRALPPTLIQSQATEWYDFQSKYAPGGSTHQCPAPLDSELTSRVQVAALQAHRAVGARDLSRSDFLLTGAGRLVVLEVNTLPGMTSVSNYPEAASVAGLSFSELADRLVQNASQRGVAQAPVAPALPGT